MYKLENNIEWTPELKNAFKHGITKGKIIYNNTTIDYDNGLKKFKFIDEKNIPGQGFIGQATAKEVDLTLLNINGSWNFENKEFELLLGADYNNQTYYINYGKFIIDSAPKNDVTNGTIEITAFDYMIKFNPLYVPNVIFPCSLKDVLDDLCEQSEVELGTQTFANMNFIVEDNQFEGKTRREVLRHIAKCAFSWARIGQDNKLYLDFEVKNTIDEEITNADYYQDKFKKANEYYGPINRVVYAESNIDGQEEKVEDTDSIALNGLHELVIYDNYFAYTTEKRQELIQAGTRLFGLKYMPIQQLEMVGLSYLETVDNIQVQDPDENLFLSMPLNHIINYDGTTKDNIVTESASSNQEAYKNTNSPINSNTNTEVMVDRAMRIIRSLIQSNSEFSQQLSLVEQELTRIGLTVEDILNLTRTKTGTNNIFIDNVQDGEGYIIKFVVKGDNNYFSTNDITLTASKNQKNEELVLDTEDGESILTQDEQAILLEKKSRYAASKNIILDDILRSLTVDGVTYYDELQILQDGTIQVIRRIGVSQSELLYLLDEEEVVVLEDTFVLPSNSEGLYYYIEELNNLDYEAEYIVKNQYTDEFATKAEVRAGLELKVDTEKLISEINASADIIRLIGQRLIIEMENYSLDETGFMKAVAGNIAGFAMDEDGFHKDYDIKYVYTNEDIILALEAYRGKIDLDNNLIDLYDVNNSGSLEFVDTALMLNIKRGTVEPVKETIGEVLINSDDPNALITISNNLGIDQPRLGIFSLFYYLLSCKKLICGEFNDSSNTTSGIIIDGENRKIMVTNGNTGSSVETLITPEGITTPKVTQTSIESEKKNFEKIENALEEVKKTDIYKYNLNFQKNDDKKQVGFVIGENYNYSNLITSLDDKGNEIGVDTYSMTSVLWAAFKEYMEITDKKMQELENEIKTLKGEK